MKKYLTLKNLGWVLLFITTFMLGNAGLDKVLGTPAMVSGFEFMKLPQFRVFVGMGELLSLVLLLIPRTSIYGAVAITSFMSGAVAIHLSQFGGQNVHVPILIGILAWSGHCLRAYPNCCQKTCDKKN